MNTPKREPPQLEHPQPRRRLGRIQSGGSGWGGYSSPLEMLAGRVSAHGSLWPRSSFLCSLRDWLESDQFLKATLLSLAIEQIRRSRCNRCVPCIFFRWCVQLDIWDDLDLIVVIP